MNYFLLLASLLLVLSCKPRTSGQLNADAGKKNAATLTATQMRMIFLTTLPEATQSEEFFARCRIDPNFRKRHLDAMQDDPMLQEKAKQGLDFRDGYLKFLEEDFGRSNLSFMIDPTFSLVEDLYASMASRVIEEEKKLPYFMVVNRAFAKVRQNPGLTAPSLNSLS